MRQRQQKIVEYVNRVGIASFADLGVIFGVSPFTIRRDADYLAKSHLVLRVKGAIQKIESPTQFREAQIVNRLQINPREKELIADCAMQFIEPGDSIFLDGSTTVSSLAINLAKIDPEVTIVTNSLLISLELAKAQNIRLIGLGGVFDSETYSFVGFEPDSQADSFHIDKAFFSSTCLIPEEGTYENAAFNGYTKRFAAQRSDKVYLLADANKIGKKALIRVLKTSQIDVFVTDKELSKKDASAFDKNDVKVVIAGNNKNHSNKK
ncbi:MAG: DeoR/GlpR transcriptional regulator [Planctomycetes bacterium]|nr:DeoR/GlpR transcriptional regulator [Planctomycetota bacterium]